MAFGQEPVDQDSEKFQSLRELGRRFALSFGVDNIRNRDALALIHHVTQNLNKNIFVGIGKWMNFSNITSSRTHDIFD